MWGLLGYGKIESDRGLQITPTNTAGYGGSSLRRTGMLQFDYSTYLHGKYLTTERSSVSADDNNLTPYLTLPTGQVLVASTIPGSIGGLTSLSFGGNGGMLQDTRKWTWETRSETAVLHRLARRSPRDGGRGFSLRWRPAELRRKPPRRFHFQLALRLERNEPASFSRTLASPALTGRVWNGFASIADLWRASPTLQLLYGLRFEANRYLDAPAFNPAVESEFGFRTDRAPNTVAVSPRIGFTWFLRPATPTEAISPMGHFFQGAPAVIRGGIGEFRNILPASLLEVAHAETGLTQGYQSVSCVGAATPVPDWTQYASDPGAIPAQCVGNVSQLSEGAPPVQLFDPNYSAPRSWRGNLAYASTYRAVGYTIEGLYSLNLDQADRTDLNFSNVPRFVLSNEGRPIFVSSSDIVPTSGALSSADARKSSMFSSVFDNVAGARSIGKQATVTVAPLLPNRLPFYFSLAYTLASNRARESGFYAPTFGSPLDAEWSRGNLDIRHQFVLSGGYERDNLALTFFGRLQSGLPFTPMVGGDVNGDGLVNDRAFIFDPARTTDASLASATRALLASSSSSVRDCLTRQMGQAAARNSCEGPWTTSLNAEIRYRMQSMPVTHSFGTVSLAFSNPLGGLDQLLHGANHLQGWGTQAFPDRVLYTPIGFDPVASTFKYAVNPRFGNTNPNNVLLRAPFRVTLDVSMQFGRPLNEQMLDHLVRGAANQKDTAHRAAALVTHYRRAVPDPYAELLDPQEQDSLLITPAQADRLASADSSYRRVADSVWNDLASYLARGSFDRAEALKRQEEATAAVWEISRREVQRTLPGILTPVQLQYLPNVTNLMYRAKTKIRARIYIG